MNKLDVVYIGDFRQSCDAVSRVVEEILINSELGFHTGLLHLPSTENDEGSIDCAIEEIIDNKLAVSLDYSEAVETRLAIIASASTAINVRPRLPIRILPDQVLAILDEPVSDETVRYKNERFIQYFGEIVTWTA